MITTRILRAFDDKAVWVVATLLLVALAIPFSNLVLPDGHPLHLPNYMVPLFGKYLTYAMLALALDLVWGFCGILSLGHAAFFAVGGYAMGMYLMRQIGSRGVYGNPLLPDFMVFLNYKELPWFWLGFDQWWFAAIVIVLAPALLAYVFGFLAFRSRVTGVYLSIITQAMTYALLLAFFRNDFGFGGNNGLTDFKDILGFSIQASTTRAGLFAASAIALAVAVLVCSFIVNSKLGKVMVAIRDAESRTRFLGYRVEDAKLFAFVVSAIIAGIAGALYVPQVGIINPGEFEPANSIEAVIWVAVGGRGTIVGAIVGAVAVNLTKSIFTSGSSYIAAAVVIVVFAALITIAGGWKRGLLVLAISVGLPALAGLLALMQTGTFALPSLSNIWLFALGGLFIFVTLFMPKGIVGTLGQFAERRRPRTGIGAGAAAEAGENPATLSLTQPTPEPAE